MVARCIRRAGSRFGLTSFRLEAEGRPSHRHDGALPVLTQHPIPSINRVREIAGNWAKVTQPPCQTSYCTVQATALTRLLELHGTRCTFARHFVIRASPRQPHQSPPLPFLFWHVPHLSLVQSPANCQTGYVIILPSPPRRHR